MHPQQLSLRKVMAGSGKNAIGEKVERWAGEGGVGVRAALGVRGAKNEREGDSPLYASLLHHANPEVIVNT